MKNLRQKIIPALLLLFLSNTNAAMQESIQRQVTAVELQAATISKKDFEIIEGRFHDGLGTFAELSLANELIVLSKISQPLFSLSRSREKMQAAIDALPPAHAHRQIFQLEISRIEMATRRGARQLLVQSSQKTLQQVLHVPREYVNARAGDVRLVFTDGAVMPISVKTDKSDKVAVAEGQTPDIREKWAKRYFSVSNNEFTQMMNEIGFASVAELKSDYLNVAHLVAVILMRKLELTDCELTDFSHARVGNLEAAKYLLRQLLHYKKGNDSSRVIIFDRQTSEVKWESLLEVINIDSLTAEQISFLPSKPRGSHRIASEFGLKVDGKTIVSFQIKHKRGKARGTEKYRAFGDITTRLRL
jgi:hypothetical protein